jgi:hypothetical protein
MHDNQWLLAWAAEDVELDGDHFVKNLRWLQRVLQSRDYPSERLVRDLEIAADVVGEDGDGRREVARRLREGAKTLRPRR